MPKRNFLFLQGLASPFMYRLGRRLRGAGHGVLRVNLSGADLVFWPEHAINFRKPAAAWPEFIESVLHEHQVSDVVLFGDCRPLHRTAISAARRLGIATHIFEEGYIRPNWITIESNGTNGYSDIPRDPDSIRALAGRLPPAPVALPVAGSFFKRASWDVIANIVGALLWPMFPHYRWHGTEHPLLEYAGWIRRFARAPVTRWRTGRTLADVVEAGRPYYLMPLQLHSDYQIRVHSPYVDAVEPVELVIRSFAMHARTDSRLLFKLHPLDNSLFNYPGKIAKLAALAGVADRVHVIDDGDLTTLLQRCLGVVLVNSSIGTQALAHGCVVKVLGTATYDMPGLTFQGPLDAFWAATTKPDEELYQAYRRVVLALTQVNGGFFDGAAIEIGTRNAAARILANQDGVLKNSARAIAAAS